MRSARQRRPDGRTRLADHPSQRTSATRPCNTQAVIQLTMDRAGAPSGRHPSSDDVLSLQRSAGNRAVGALLGRHSHGGVHVQRHESPEHNALGTIPPKELANIANARDLVRKLGMSPLFVDVGKNKVLDDAIHTLQEERRRVRDFQRNPPEDVTAEYSVRLVKIDNDHSEDSKPVIATYGELNMLADFFGSLRELRMVSNQTIFKLLQTERQVYDEWLGKFLRELTWFDPSYYYGEEMKGGGEPDFESSQKGFGLLDVFNPVEGFLSRESEYHGADMALARDPGVTAGKTGGAWGSVARNACHFAPQNWYAWKENHELARQLAMESAQLRAGACENEDDYPEELLARADELANEALLTNGFADHYLQDSFAAGHLLNKTLIMQWFLAKVKDYKFFGPGGLELERRKQMSEGAQPGLATRHLYSKSLSVESMGPQAEAEAPTAAEGFERAGLQLPSLAPDAREVLLWWRRISSDSRGHPQTLEQVASGLSWDEERTKAALGELGRARFVYIENPFPGHFEYWLNDAADEARSAMADIALPEKSASGAGYDPAATMLLGAYHEFTNDAMLQSGALALHDLFCRQGLWVSSDESPQLFKLYGDKHLLDADAGPGLEKAGETSRMSQGAIEGLLAGESDVPSVQEIFARLPSKILTPAEFASQGAPVGVFDIEQFHDDLRPWLEQRLEDGHWMAARLPEELGGTRLTSRETISPHAGEEF